MWRDIREAARKLTTHPGLTAIILGTLALTIGVNTTIFSALNGVLLRPLDYVDADRLVMMWENNENAAAEREPISAATFVDWRERSRAFESMAAYQYHGFTLTEGAEPIRMPSVDISPALFRVLGVSPVIGRALTDDDERPGREDQVILSHATWQQHFGSDPTIIDTRIRLDGQPYTVVGVMPESFRFPADDPNIAIWSPLTLSLEDLPSRPHRSYSAIGKLAAGFTLEQAREEMSVIAAGIAQENPESNAGWSVTLESAHAQLVADVSTTLWFLQAAVVLVLLIGCANIANLLLVQSTESTRDFAVRAAFGAKGSALLRRSLAESGLLALLGGVIGLGIAYAGVSFLRTVMPPNIPRADEIGIDLTVLGFTLATTTLAGFVFGIVPALRNMHPNLATSLQDGGRGMSVGRKTRWIANAMVVSEVALALVLLTGAGLMVRSFAKLLNVDPGFRTSGIVSVAVSLPQSRYSGFERQKQFYLDLVERVRTLPGLESVGAVSALPMSPLGTEFDMPFSREGLDVASPSERPMAEYRAVIPGYFETMGIPVVLGRDVNNFDDGSRKVAIINESLRQRYFNDVDPIGQQLLRAPMIGDMEIVGVVGDVRHSGLDATPQPEMFVPFVQLPLGEMHIIARTRATIESAAAAIRAEVLALDPQLPVSAATGIDELIATTVAPSRFNMILLVALACSAALLAAVGIYGVVSYSVTRRTGEIGVRVALGASGQDAVMLIVKQILSVTAIGIVIGIVLALGFSRFIAGMLYGVTPTDPLTYIAVAGGLIGVAVLASTIPATRASRVDPVVALRQQ